MEKLKRERSFFSCLETDFFKPFQTELYFASFLSVQPALLTTVIDVKFKPCVYRIAHTSKFLACMHGSFDLFFDVFIKGAKEGRRRKREEREREGRRRKRLNFNPKTQNILYVMQKLGHKNIKNTLIYTHLVNFESDEYHSTVAKTTEKARKLIEAGFEYVCTTPEDLMLFRKRK